VPEDKSQRPRVLVAGTSDAIALLERLLGAQAELVPARSVREALARFDEGGYDVIACNVRFDESRMFEFLQGLRERPGGDKARVVCFRAEGTELSSSMRSAIRHGLEALGVTTFVDLPQLTADHGPEAAAAVLEHVIFSRPWH
jgi:CheY-like chemotaxis protein